MVLPVISPCLGETLLWSFTVPSWWRGQRCSGPCANYHAPRLWCDWAKAGTLGSSRNSMANVEFLEYMEQNLCWRERPINIFSSTSSPQDYTFSEYGLEIPRGPKIILGILNSKLSKIIVLRCYLPFSLSFSSLTSAWWSFPEATWWMI